GDEGSWRRQPRGCGRTVRVDAGGPAGDHQGDRGEDRVGLFPLRGRGPDGWRRGTAHPAPRGRVPLRGRGPLRLRGRGRRVGGRPGDAPLPAQRRPARLRERRRRDGPAARGPHAGRVAGEFPRGGRRAEDRRGRTPGSGRPGVRPSGGGARHRDMRGKTIDRKEFL
ncbi:MAG: hypothetical protein AVDCRST_MAG03-879, partial [uncultured Rubrobacteraceae bacterium]